MNEGEDTRLAEFRQFKKEIRGSKEYLIVGIDIAKEKHHAFFGTATGKTLLRRLIFDNAIEGFEKLLTQVRAIQVAQGLPKVVFGLEPTANSTTNPLRYALYQAALIASTRYRPWIEHYIDQLQGWIRDAGCPPSGRDAGY